MHVAGDEDARRRRSASRVRQSMRAARLRVRPSWSSSGCCSVPSKPMASSTRSAGAPARCPAPTVTVRAAVDALDAAPRRSGPPRTSPCAVADELLHGDARRPARRPPRGPGSCAGSTARSATGRASRRGRSGGSGYWSSWVTAGRALPVGDAEAVGAGVAAADDDHVLAGARRSARRPAGRRRPGWPATRCSIARCTPLQLRGPGVVRRVPAGQRAAGQQHRVVPVAQLVGGDVDADVARRSRSATPSAASCASRAVDVLLLQLEVGDAVAQQAADRVVALVDGDRVAGPGQLLGGGQPGRAGADHGHRLAGRRRRRLRARPARRRTRGW